MVFQTISLTRMDAEVLRRALRKWDGVVVASRPREPDDSYNECYAVLLNHSADLATRLNQLCQDFRDDELADSGVTSAEIPF